MRRAVLLMGPRRVGKTVLLRHAIRVLLERGARPARIFYVSVDHPLFNGLGLGDLLSAWEEAAGVSIGEEEAFVFFDEIQYLRDWERHLKVLIYQHPSVRFVASGSAAALKLKSQESGAGRFTDFLLPPLTFSEYLSLTGNPPGGPVGPGLDVDVEELNRRFVSYVNFGGYPEGALSPEIQADPGRFVKADIIDKVLLRDLPSLYGIEDVQELNALFTTLAFNSANEVSLEGLSKKSGVAKNTLKRYIEYLEAAFLLEVVHRVDRNARRFQRATAFKVYLTNPSMRAVLFARQHGLDEVVVTTRTARAKLRIDGVDVHLIPAAIYYLRVGAESVAQPTGDVAQRVLARGELEREDAHAGEVLAMLPAGEM